MAGKTKPRDNSGACARQAEVLPSERSEVSINKEELSYHSTILIILSLAAELVHHCTQKGLYFPSIREDMTDLQSWLHAAADSQLGNAAMTIINFSYSHHLS